MAYFEFLKIHYRKVYLGKYTVHYWLDACVEIQLIEMDNAHICYVKHIKNKQNINLNVVRYQVFNHVFDIGEKQPNIMATLPSCTPQPPAGSLIAAH